MTDRELLAWVLGRLSYRQQSAGLVMYLYHPEAIHGIEQAIAKQLGVELAEIVVKP